VKRKTKLMRDLKFSR